MAWLYLPEVGDSNSDSLLPSENITDQSPTLKGKQRPLQSWQRTWNEGGWIRLLSGMTLQPSQAMSLAHSWITSTLSQQDFLANRGQSQDSEKELMTNDGSGLLSSDWFAKYDHEASSWRTSQVSFMEELNTFSETWPRSGSMRNGQVFEHQMLAHPIAERGSLSWATATALDRPRSPEEWKTPTTDSASQRTARYKQGGLPLATQAAQNWASPVAADAAQGAIENENTKYIRLKSGRLRKIANSGESGSLGLAREVRHWLTPSANEDAAGTVDGKMQNMLSHQAQVEIGVTSQNDSGQRLNPLFVEWLMGWPEGWLETTDSESSATE